MSAVVVAPAKTPLLTPLLRWFLFAMILANIASGMIHLLIPIYLTELGASVGQVGLVFTATSAFVFVLQMLGGWVSDSIGRLRAIALGSLGGVLGFVFMLLAPTWQWMMLALAVSQIPFALVAPSFSALIAENSTPENRGRVYGLIDTYYQIVGVVGPPLGGWMAGAWGFRVVLLATTLLYSAAAGLRVWMARTMRSAGERAPQALSAASFASSARAIGGLLVGGGVVTWIFVTDGVRDIAFRLSSELQPLYLQQIGGLSLAEIGLLGAVLSVAMMTTPMLSGRLSDRYGERVPISAGFLLIGLALGVFLLSRAFAGFAAAWLVAGAGVGLLSPAYQSLISKVVPRERLGAFNGLFHGSLGFISLGAPWAGAQLWERISPGFPFAITGLVALMTIVPIWLKFRVPPGESA
jgi:MFS family permease